MKLSAALQYEGMRDDPQSWNKIYLNKDGKFFHAYQWSAWLLKRYVCTEELQQSRGDEKMLAASRTPTKDGEYVMAGFPVESLGKSHYSSYNIRRELMLNERFLRVSTFDNDISTFNKPIKSLAA